jgi:hypothetical protein
VEKHKQNELQAASKGRSPQTQIREEIRKKGIEVKGMLPEYNPVVAQCVTKWVQKFALFLTFLTFQKEAEEIESIEFKMKEEIPQS